MKSPMVLLLWAAVLQAQEACAISGTVIDAISGTPIARVKVFAEAPDSDEAPAPVRRLTNTDGQFCFEHLTGGSYNIKAQKAGYLEMSYGQRHAGSPGLPVMVRADGPSLPPLGLKMTPQATISGVATDAEGDAKAFAEIRLWERPAAAKAKPSQSTTAEADEQGRFRLWGIAPGTYYVSALPQAARPERMARASLDGAGQPFREREVETFYGGSLSVGNATAIVVKAGQEITGITVPIQKAGSRRINGRIVWPSPGSDLAHVQVMVWRSNEGLPQTIKVERDGRFHAEGLAPGDYSIRAFSPDGKQSAQKKLDLTDGDAEGVVLQTSEPLDGKVVAHVEGSKVELATELTLLNKEGEGQTVEQEEDGSWHFNGLTPDVYHFEVWSNSLQYFVKRWLVDGEVQAGTAIDLRTRRPQSIEVVLGVSSGVIRGQVTNGKEPAPAAVVALVDEATHGIVRSQGVTAEGKFEMKLLAPGKYRLYALEDFDRDAWAADNLEAMLRPKSTAVELRDGETRQVTVPLVLAKESALQ